MVVKLSLCCVVLFTVFLGLLGGLNNVLSHCQSLEFLYVCVYFAKIHKFVFLTNVKLFLSIWKLRNYTENKTNSRKLPKKISRFLSRQLPPRQWHASANIRMCSSIFELFAQYLEKFWLFVVVVFLVSNLTLKTLANIRPFDSGDDTWSLWSWTASPQNSFFQYLCFFCDYCGFRSTIQKKQKFLS